MLVRYRLLRDEYEVVGWTSPFEIEEEEFRFLEEELEDTLDDYLLPLTDYEIEILEW